MTPLKFAALVILILLLYRMVKGSVLSSIGVGPDRKAIPRNRQRTATSNRVQCPWCESWNVSQYRDLRSVYLFLLFITLGLILLLMPIFPKVNLCNNCGRRWTFGMKR